MAKPDLKDRSINELKSLASMYWNDRQKLRVENQRLQQEVSQLKRRIEEQGSAMYDIAEVLRVAGYIE